MIEAAFNLGDVQEPNWRNMHMALIPKGGATVPPPQSWPDLRGTVLVYDEGPSPDGCIAGSETPWAILNPTLPPGAARWLNFTPPGTRLQHTNPLRPGNLACTGHTWTVDGRLFVTAGNELHGTGPGLPPNPPCIRGGKHTYLFDPRQGTAGNSMWIEQTATLTKIRWYPAVVLITAWVGGVLQTRVVVLGGNHDPLGANNYQVWEPPLFPIQQGTWEQNGFEFPGPPPAGSDFGVYAYSHLMSDGKVVVTPFFGATSSDPSTPLTTRLLHDSATGTGAWTPLTDPNPVSRLRPRIWGCSLIFPNLDASHMNSVLQLGGSLTNAEIPTLDAQICRPQQAAAQCWPNGHLWTDLPSTNPHVCSTMPEMLQYRYAPNAVLLPDGSFLVVGGSGAMEIERYDAGGWHACASLQKYSTLEPVGGYGFHSTALLLPSGKVLIGGGNLVNALHKRWDFQVYVPNYIADGAPRPQVVDVNLGVEQIQYNQIFKIKHEIVPGVAINKVVLMRPSSVTHGFNSDQRYIELEIIPPVEEEVPGEIMARMPPRAPGHPAMQPTDVSGPPGFYMLFLVSTARIPSEAAWVQLVP